MKFTAGIVLAAIAVAGVSAESTITVDPKTLTHVDPASIIGIGPVVPAGNDPKMKKAMEQLAGSHSASGSGNYYTIDPRTMPTQNPAYLEGLGPQMPVKDLPKESSTNTLQIDPNTLPVQDPKYLEGLGPQTPAGDNPKLKKAMESLEGSHDASSGSNYYTINPHDLPKYDPSFGFGPGPVVLPGMPGYGKNEAANKAWEEFQKQDGGSNNGKTRKLEAAESTNTLTIDPKTFPTQDPKYLEGLGPQTPAGDNPKLKKAMEQLAGSHESSSGSNYYTIDPRTLPTQDPKYLEGLGPQTPAGPNVKKAMTDFASKDSGTTTTLDTTKTATPTLNPAMYEGLGPAMLPGMPGYGQNAQFNKAWKEFTHQQSASTSASGSGVSNCPDACPDVYTPVCGSDGNTYSNSCFLGIASCKNPDKHIAQASEGSCPN
ncbi:Kazal-type serine protease inhibitor domain [Phytophthora infestans]|uniref:Kazal-type serine protease inhibitor domain n=1 Tax=Phytophthora infestans TaxID=4787 RepID=A0A833SUL3_PHYIN|nr:Kazal-type serine protease inhibitor domain [Phytophthora infestans]